MARVEFQPDEAENAELTRLTKAAIGNPLPDEQLRAEVSMLPRPLQEHFLERLGNMHIDRRRYAATEVIAIITRLFGDETGRMTEAAFGLCKMIGFDLRRFTKKRLLDLFQVVSNLRSKQPCDIEMVFFHLILESWLLPRLSRHQAAPIRRHYAEKEVTQRDQDKLDQTLVQVPGLVAELATRGRASVTDLVAPADRREWAFQTLRDMAQRFVQYHGEVSFVVNGTFYRADTDALTICYERDRLETEIETLAGEIRRMDFELRSSEAANRQQLEKDRSELADHLWQLRWQVKFAQGQIAQLEMQVLMDALPALDELMGADRAIDNVLVRLTEAPENIRLTPKEAEAQARELLARYLTDVGLPEKAEQILSPPEAA